MQIIYKDKNRIITPLSPRLDKLQSSKLINEINIESGDVSLDLGYVSDCTIEFIDGLKELSKSRHICIFNIPSDIFALFNVMHIDKYVKIFVNNLDCEENVRQIINRKFAIVKNFN